MWCDLFFESFHKLLLQDRPCHRFATYLIAPVPLLVSQSSFCFFLSFFFLFLSYEMNRDIDREYRYNLGKWLIERQAANNHKLLLRDYHCIYALMHPLNDSFHPLSHTEVEASSDLLGITSYMKVNSAVHLWLPVVITSSDNDWGDCRKGGQFEFVIRMILYHSWQILCSEEAVMKWRGSGLIKKHK